MSTPKKSPSQTNKFIGLAFVAATAATALNVGFDYLEDTCAFAPDAAQTIYARRQAIAGKPVSSEDLDFYLSRMQSREAQCDHDGNGNNRLVTIYLKTAKALAVEIPDKMQRREQEIADCRDTAVTEFTTAIQKHKEEARNFTLEDAQDIVDIKKRNYKLGAGLAVSFGLLWGVATFGSRRREP